MQNDFFQVLQALVARLAREPAAALADLNAIREHLCTPANIRIQIVCDVSFLLFLLIMYMVWCVRGSVSAWVRGSVHGCGGSESYHRNHVFVCACAAVRATAISLA